MILSQLTKLASGHGSYQPIETGQRKLRAGTSLRQRCNTMPLHGSLVLRHCEERSDEAIQSCFQAPGLLRFARNDGFAFSAKSQPTGAAAL
jgi:hypothetical protein